MRKEQIIKELEEQLGVELDSNFDASILCDGDTCRHSECFCWNVFEEEVKNQLIKQRLQTVAKNISNSVSNSVVRVRKNWFLKIFGMLS